MPYSFVLALFEHWRTEPTVDALFAAFVGYKPPVAKPQEGVRSDKRRPLSEEELRWLDREPK